MLKDTDKIILYKQGDFTDYDFVGIENLVERYINLNSLGPLRYIPPRDIPQEITSTFRFTYYNKENSVRDFSNAFGPVFSADNFLLGQGGVNGYLIDNALAKSRKQLQNVDLTELTELKELLDSNGICLTDNQKMIIIKIERGMMITWDNKKSSHFVVSNKNGSRTMIGPCDNVMRPVGNGDEFGTVSFCTAGLPLTECELPVRKVMVIHLIIVIYQYKVMLMLWVYFYMDL